MELVRSDSKEVVFTARGQNRENLQAVVADLGCEIGHEIFIRMVDGQQGAWGRINFDDFRFRSGRNPRQRTQAGNNYCAPFFGASAPLKWVLNQTGSTSHNEAIKRVRLVALSRTPSMGHSICSALMEPPAWLP